MQPRVDVVTLDVDCSAREIVELALAGNHSRYPVCRGSLDNVLGFVHIKDLIGMSAGESFNLSSIIRPAHFVPETVPISQLLRQFQASHRHLAFVVDEYGSVVGIVTLEDIIEQIVGPVEDEFDSIEPGIVPCDSGGHIVLGGVHVEQVNRALDLDLDTERADTLSGYLMALHGKVPATGDRVDLLGAVAEVLEISGTRARKIRITPLTREEPAIPPSPTEGTPKGTG